MPITLVLFIEGYFLLCKPQCENPGADQAGTAGTFCLVTLGNAREVRGEKGADQVKDIAELVAENLVLTGREEA